MPETKLGIALSGGSVRGAAHCGVLSVLDEEGIRADVIAGTSAGAAVGAGYSLGIPPRQIATMLRGLSLPSVAKFSGVTGLGFFSSNPWGEFLTEAFEAATFDDTDIRLIIVACDVLTGDRILLTEGDVATAVRASSALPGLFEPVLLDDMMLIDGGTVDNYPASVPFEFGATVVVGVDVGAKARIDPPRTPIGVALAAAELRSKTTGIDVAHVNIEPDVSGFSSFDFDSTDEIYERGRRAAHDAMPAIVDAIETGELPIRES